MFQGKKKKRIEGCVKPKLTACTKRWKQKQPGTEGTR